MPSRRKGAPEQSYSKTLLIFTAATVTSVPHCFAGMRSAWVPLHQEDFSILELFALVTYWCAGENQMSNPTGSRLQEYTVDVCSGPSRERKTMLGSGIVSLSNAG